MQRSRRICADGYVYPGELFAIDQYVPGGYYDLGGVYARLPTTTFVGEAVTRGVTGAGSAELTFTAEDPALIKYVETFGSCHVSAE